MGLPISTCRAGVVINGKHGVTVGANAISWNRFVHDPFDVELCKLLEQFLQSRAVTEMFHFQ